MLVYSTFFTVRGFIRKELADGHPNRAAGYTELHYILYLIQQPAKMGYTDICLSILTSIQSVLFYSPPYSYTKSYYKNLDGTLYLYVKTLALVIHDLVVA